MSPDALPRDDVCRTKEAWATKCTTPPTPYPPTTLFPKRRWVTFATLGHTHTHIRMHIHTYIYTHRYTHTQSEIGRPAYTQDKPAAARACPRATSLAPPVYLKPALHTTQGKGANVLARGAEGWEARCNVMTTGTGPLAHLRRGSSETHITCFLFVQ